MSMAEYERRIVAYIVDFFLVFIIVSIEYFFLIPFPAELMSEIITILISLNMAIYLSLSYIILSGNSLGGLMLGVRIVGTNGKPMIKRVAILRALLLSLPLLVVYNAVYMLYKRTQISFFDECSNTRAVQRRGIE